MNEKEVLQDKEMEIDMQKVFSAILKRAWLVILVSVLCAAIVFVGTLCLITPKYEAKAMFYVNNNALSVGDASFSLSSGDLSTSRNLVESYIVILNTRESLNEVISYAGVERSYEELKKMISAEAVNETEIFQVTVTSPDPREAENIANAIAEILPERISSIIEGTSAKVVDAAVMPSKPSSPNYTTNTAIGFLLGFVLVVGIIALWEIFDVTIRTEEDLAHLNQYPILAAVPDMMERSKGGPYYGSAHKKKQGKRYNRDQDLVGARVPFAAAEAYKLLRTKIQFSFADGKDCHVIGVSSALAGEGKSTSSINLAYALAQLNKKVLLIDCDLRRPSVAAKLELDQTHGLSSFLTNQSRVEQIVQRCTLKDGVTFMAIPAGPIPPNPTELLSSVRMETFVNWYSQRADYIILDLPPVDEVSDALVASKLTHGVLLAVRQNYCNRMALEDTVRQFEFVKGRILGFLLNCATDSGSGYGKSYYKRYYSRYGKYDKYAKSYEESHMKNMKRNEHGI